MRGKRLEHEMIRRMWYSETLGTMGRVLIFSALVFLGIMFAAWMAGCADTSSGNAADEHDPATIFIDGGDTNFIGIGTPPRDVLLSGVTAPEACCDELVFYEVEAGQAVFKWTFSVSLPDGEAGILLAEGYFYSITIDNDLLTFTRF